MSYEHKPHNPNHGGVSRSGRTSGFDHTNAHPSDRWNWTDTLLAVAIVAAIIAIGLTVTVWADIPMGGAR